MPVTGIDPMHIVQVGLVVRDIERSAARYAEIFNLDVPQIEVLDDDATYKGQFIRVKSKITWFDMGAIQVELFEPLGSPSTWQDFLDQHGEGIHHIAFPVLDTDAAAASFAEYGYEIVQQGMFTDQNGKYTYLNTDKDLGVILELMEVFNPYPVVETSPFPADKGIGTNRVCQVGIMVHDIQKTAQRIADVLGLQYGAIFATPGYDVVKTTYNGQRCDAIAQLAFFNAGQSQIELIQPDPEASCWRAFLEERGERAHHLAFQVKDTQQVIDYLAGQNIPVIQQGLYGDLSGIYTYMASEGELAVALELLESYPR
jgi:catechol 2,3-dioxygenase-like lactoylglutathione lyase family enzyme